MEPLTIEEAFEYCLQNLGALTTEQLLAKFPQYSQELAQLLTLDRQLKSTLPGSSPISGFGQLEARIKSSIANVHKGEPPTQEIGAKDVGVDRLLSQAAKRTIKPVVHTPVDPAADPGEAD
ncbi:MAG: hypothetical protein ABJA50_04615 [Chloroflexota bacterium]